MKDEQRVGKDADTKEQVNSREKMAHWKWIAVYLIVYDMVAVTFSYFFALLLRFDFKFSAIPDIYFNPWKEFAAFYAVFCLAVFALFKLYKSIWRFASFKELQRILIATIVTTAFHVVVITLVWHRMPISYYVMGAGTQMVLITAIRFGYRFVLLFRSRRAAEDADNVMIIGAGAAGTVLLRELRRKNAVNERAVCIIDDNPNKWNRDIDGVPVVGGRDRIAEAVEKYDVKKIYLAIPSMSKSERRKLLNQCKETGCELKALPGIYQLALGQVSVSDLKKVEIEDLLGRDQVKMNYVEVRQMLQNKTILVTGGGGSIGSEICRQVAEIDGIKRLIIFDIYENNAHAIKLELEDKYPDMELTVLIGSVRNSRKIKQVFSDYRPDIVFHAAAHKHVPLMEDSPCEAIKNNAIGTYYTAFAAMAYGCEKFVLISTDKAVNPVNIMGASKRLCEMIVQAFAGKIAEGRASEIPDMHAHTGTNRLIQDHITIPDKPKTEFVAVRFGNVLGSNGSVIPRFREQIEKGGPVTVTHPDIIRYFMTIPEASSLVLTAAAFGGGGRIFVLDMGTPVKIADMARTMIELSGQKPDEDIKIVYTGLRPGEKLYEERLMDEEGMTSTANELINIGHPIEFDEEAFFNQMRELMNAAYEDREDIRDMVADMVDTYRPAGREGSEERGKVYEKQCSEMTAKIVMMESAKG